MVGLQCEDWIKRFRKVHKHPGGTSTHLESSPGDLESDTLQHLNLLESLGVKIQW